MNRFATSKREIKAYQRCTNHLIMLQIYMIPRKKAHEALIMLR